jgi:hypothetical protein
VLFSVDPIVQTSSVPEQAAVSSNSIRPCHVISEFNYLAISTA